MINHVMIGTNNIDSAKSFYDAVLAVLGASGAIRLLNSLNGGQDDVFPCYSARHLGR